MCRPEARDSRRCGDGERQVMELVSLDKLDLLRRRFASLGVRFRIPRLDKDLHETAILLVDDGGHGALHGDVGFVVTILFSQVLDHEHRNLVRAATGLRECVLTGWYTRSRV